MGQTIDMIMVDNKTEKKSNSEILLSRSSSCIQENFGRVTLPQNLADDGTISQSQVENFFVETCFFARLGFLQPPCCLKCAYINARPSTNSLKVNAKQYCNNLVVWRVCADSDHLLHPDKLDGNAIFVTCSTAMAWQRGEKIHNIRWDNKAKKLISII